MVLSTILYDSVKYINLEGYHWSLLVFVFLFELTFNLSTSSFDRDTFDILELDVMFSQVMKTYHMYHTESLSAESKLKEAEKQEEKHIGKANDVSTSLLRYGHDERPQRRSSVKKMEKMKEKVCSGAYEDVALCVRETVLTHS